MKTATRIALVLVLAAAALIMASPAIADVSFDAARLDPLVVTATAPVPSGYVAPAPDDAIGWLKWSALNTRDGHLKMAAGGLLVLLVWGARALARQPKFMDSTWLSWVKTKWGGRAFLFTLGVAGGFGHALAASVPWTLDLFLACVETTALGVMGWEIARDKVEPTAPKALA